MRSLEKERTSPENVELGRIHEERKSVTITRQGDMKQSTHERITLRITKFFAIEVEEGEAKKINK